MRRRTLVIGGTTVVATTLFAGREPGVRKALAQDWDPRLTEFDRVLGSADAPVTIIEYSSFTCPHCADFHADVLPDLKREYIDPGLVRLVFRDFPLDGWALRAGMLARCAPESQYFALIDTLFSSQQQWVRAEDPMEALSRIGRLAGIGQADFDACMVDEDLANRIVELRLQGQERYEVDATPTFIINGETVSGARSFESFAEILDGMIGG